MGRRRRRWRRALKSGARMSPRAVRALAARPPRRMHRQQPETRRPGLAVVRLAELVGDLVELAAKLLDIVAVRPAARIFRFQLDLLGGLLAKIADRQPPAEHVVAADLHFGLVIGRKIVADRLQVADQVVERGVLANVDEVLDASRHRQMLSGGTWRA